MKMQSSFLQVKSRRPRFTVAATYSGVEPLSKPICFHPRPQFPISSHGTLITRNQTCPFPPFCSSPSLMALFPSSLCSQTTSGLLLCFCSMFPFLDVSHCCYDQHQMFTFIASSCSAHIPLLQDALRARGLGQSRLCYQSPQHREGGTLSVGCCSRVREGLY